MTSPILRAARDDDSSGVIALVGRVFAEYPGCLLDVDAEEPELRAPASSFPGFWVVEYEDEIVGCGALRVVQEEARERCYLCKLYLDRVLRGRGLGRALIERIEGAARERGAGSIELWSDTRFLTAHGVYESLGYVRSGRERELHDLSNTREWHFWKTL
jgi:putative acetyltransferase